MRKLIIDTDTGSDDAIALMMALRSPEVQVLAVTTVAGNVPLVQATQNALMTIQVAGGQVPPVFMGAEKPLQRELFTARDVHGHDGMGDRDLIHPKGKAQGEHAVDAMLSIVAQHPGEVEIVAIGPVTNIALAIRKAPDVMRGVKRIYSMGTAGFGPGNVTPVAEFNVFVDAESYAVMLGSGCPVTIVGYDLCTGDAALSDSEIEALAGSGSEAAAFAVSCSAAVAAMNERRTGQRFMHLPDPLAMGVCLWSDIVEKQETCGCYVCVQEAPAYGQVIFYEQRRLEAGAQGDITARAQVVRAVNSRLFKQRLISVLTQ